MFYHVLPCFTMFYHVWPCLKLMRKDWENDDDHVSDHNDICWGLDCNIQGYSSGLVRSMYSSMPCLTTVSSTMARGLRRRSSRPASKSSWWSIDVKMMWEDHDDENNGVIYCHAAEVLTSVFNDNWLFRLDGFFGQMEDKGWELTSIVFLIMTIFKIIIIIIVPL